MLDEIIIPGSAGTNALNALTILAGTREVEVDLPILKIKAMVKPILNSEELKLHTMKASGSTFIKSFNKVLFEHTTFTEVKFQNLSDFEKHLTPPDKSMLVFAMLDATFSKLPEKIITCPGCGKTDNYSPNPSELMHSDTIPKIWNNEVDFDKFEIVSEIVPGFKVIYSMPSETDRIAILEAKENSEMRDSLNNNGDVLSSLELFSIYIKRLEIKNGEEEDIILTDKVNDIVPTVKGMPLELQSQLLDDISVAPLVEFTPHFYLDINCSNVGCELKQFKWEGVNPEQDFFRKALSVYN
ncbi:MAG: hypothetical protein DRG78_08470 [Epsilonproteobacteria bacterium]|nr:MAG: hypothetical protein DRG78_08470 [Campylobacterota bacterium]